MYILQHAIQILILVSFSLRWFSGRVQGQPDGEKQSRGGRVRPKGKETFLIPGQPPDSKLRLCWFCFSWLWGWFQYLFIVHSGHHLLQNHLGWVEYVGYILLLADLSYLHPPISDLWSSPPDHSNILWCWSWHIPGDSDTIRSESCCLKLFVSQGPHLSLLSIDNVRSPA